MCSQRYQHTITSGGGYSSNFRFDEKTETKDREDFPSELQGQKPFVKKYTDAMRDTLTTQGADLIEVDRQFPTNRHAIPDVSAIATSFIIFAKNLEYIVDGTSASAPLVAGMITRMNLQRAARGQSTLKVINDFLYGSGARDEGDNPFNDIEDGDNCAGQLFSPRMSGNFISAKFTECYSARTGWDPASGLGSIKFGNLAKMANDWNPDVHPLHDDSSDDGVNATAIAVGITLSVVLTIGLVIGIILYRARRAEQLLVEAEVDREGAPSGMGTDGAPPRRGAGAVPVEMSAPTAAADVDPSVVATISMDNDAIPSFSDEDDAEDDDRKPLKGSA